MCVLKVGGDQGELSHVLHLYHSAEMKGRIPKLNVVSKTLEGLLALYNVTVGPIAAGYPQERYRKNGKMVQLSLRRGELSHHCRRVVPP